MNYEPKLLNVFEWTKGFLLKSDFNWGIDKVG